MASWVSARVKFVWKLTSITTLTMILTSRVKKLVLLSRVVIYCTSSRRFFLFKFFERLWFHSVVILQDDAYWWQARKEVDKTTRAGLIPSRALQERRIIHERNQAAKETNGSESKSELNLSLSILFLLNHATSIFKLIFLLILFHLWFMVLI